MRYWILMFKPETYKVVQEHGTIGVLANHGRRFADLAAGDRFITYVSRDRVLDGHGEVLSEPFDDTTAIGAGWGFYPHRARVRLDQTGCARDAKELLWGLSPFQGGIRTSPGNLLFCRGGFMEITEQDYKWARSVLDGSWTPPA